VQRGESHPHLRLNADDSQDSEIAGVGDGVVEERRLADSRFATQHEGAGAAGSGGVENAIDRRPLRAATEKHDADATESSPIPDAWAPTARQCRRLPVLGDSSGAGVLHARC